MNWIAEFSPIERNTVHYLDPTIASIEWLAYTICTVLAMALIIHAGLSLAHGKNPLNSLCSFAGGLLCAAGPYIITPLMLLP